MVTLKYYTECDQSELINFVLYCIVKKNVYCIGLCVLGYSTKVYIRKKSSQNFKVYDGYFRIPITICRSKFKQFFLKRFSSNL